MDTPNTRTVIEVRYNTNGWWDVRAANGEVLARYISEFQAWEAGRVAARNRAADLVIHQKDGPVKHEAYDELRDSLHPVEPPSGAPDQRPSVRAAQAAPRALILLVEDAVEARELYAQYLTYAGFSVVTAINGHEAVRLARLLSPDLILMDLRMPGMDGLEATIDLKHDPSVAHIPVVAMTADMSHEVSERARLAGCAAFISKPAMPDEIAERIARILALPPQG